MHPTADPDALGFDPARLARIDTHFAAYVDDGRLAGWQIVVARRGEVVRASTYGMRDLEAGLPVAPDTLWRIYSMTKPITSVAAMILWEEGWFELNDEVGRYIPAFADVRVFGKGSAQKPYTVPATAPIRMWHLLTHTAGLTYGFLYTSIVDQLYRAAGYELGVPEGQDLPAACEGWASLPLLFQPGSAWGYSVATDVLGRVVEVLSGRPLDQFFAERIFAPLGMKDTRWWVDENDAERLAALYRAHPLTGKAVRHDALGKAALRPPRFLSGGGAHLDRGRLRAVHDDAAARWRARRGPAARQPDPALYGTEPPPGRKRPRRPEHRRVRGDRIRRCGVRPRLRRRRGRTAAQDAGNAGRVLLGRPGEHRLLGGSRRGGHRAAVHPARPVEHLPAALTAAPARLLGARQLTPLSWVPSAVQATSLIQAHQLPLSCYERQKM